MANNEKNFLFNGNHENDYANFDKYLNNHHYKFKNISNEIGGYAVLRNKNVSIAMDLGSPPEKNFLIIISLGFYLLK